MLKLSDVVSGYTDVNIIRSVSPEVDKGEIGSRQQGSESAERERRVPLIAGQPADVTPEHDVAAEHEARQGQRVWRLPGRRAAEAEH